MLSLKWNWYWREKIIGFIGIGFFIDFSENSTGIEFFNFADLIKNL